MSWQLTDEEQSKLADCMGFAIDDPTLLSRAFLHSTYINEHPEVRELEPLPVPLDSLAVEALELCIFEFLFRERGEYSPGRSNEAYQAIFRAVPERIEEQWCLKEFWKVSEGSKNIPTKGTIALNVLGAIYVTRGYAFLRRILLPMLSDEIGNFEGGNGFQSLKYALQVYVEKRHGTVEYETIKTEGPPHARVFTSLVRALGREAKGTASSKKQADEAAARAYFYQFVPKQEVEALLQRNAPTTNTQRCRRPPISGARLSRLEDLAGEIDIGPDALNLLDMALTRSSFSHENPGYASNERLLQIGARALRFLTLASFWIGKDRANVALTPELSTLVKNQLCSVESRVATYEKLRLDDVLRLGKGEARIGVSPQVKADAVYAVLGAIVESHAEAHDPMAVPMAFFTRHFNLDVGLVRNQLVDPTTLLQEVAALFGCRLDLVRKTSQDQLNTIIITLVDDTTGKQTALTWEGVDQNLRNAAKLAASKAMNEMRLRLDLTTSEPKLRLWRAVAARLVKRLGRSIRLDQMELIADLFGGLGIDAFRTGNYDVGFQDLVTSVDNLNKMGIQHALVVKTVVRLAVTRPVLLRQEAVVAAFEGLRDWLRTLAPNTCTTEANRHLELVMDILSVARGLNSSSTATNLGLKDIVDKVLLIASRQLKITNEIDENTTVTAQEDLVYAIFYRVLTSIRDASPDSEVVVRTAVKKVPACSVIKVAFDVSTDLQIPFLTSQLEVVQEFCQIILSRMVVHAHGVFIEFTQPDPTLTEVKEVFQELIGTNLRAMTSLALIGPVVHDLKNQLLVLRQRLMANRTQEFDIPLLQVRNMLVRVSESVLHYLKASAKPNIALVNLHDFSSAVFRQVRSLVKDPQVQVRPRSSFDVEYVMTDEAFLNSIILNLSKNALEAMPFGGVVDITFKVGACVLEISVSDSGVGIPERRMRTLFTKIESTKKDSGGSGLGLLAVYRYVKSLDGDIEVKSAPGQGTCFAVTIPVQVPAGTSELQGVDALTV